jgi:16S rRNA (cytosine967-C5)-methyltransferase
MLPLSTLLVHAAQALQGVRRGRSLDDELAALPDAIRPGAQAITFHALRRLGAAEWARRQLAPRAPPPAIDALLLVALSLLWPMTSPDDGEVYADHTVADQAVVAARSIQAASAGFVNAVLRRFVRERATLVAKAQGDPVARHNHLLWWIQRLYQDWPEQALALLSVAHRPPPMTLRINLQRSSVAAASQALAEAGMANRRVPFGPAADEALVLQRACAVSLLPGFSEGRLSVQDAAAQWAAPLLLHGLSPAQRGGMRVLDACAAPGGKTAHLLEMEPSLRLTAIDHDTRRLDRIHQNLQRLGLTATVRHADAREPGRWWDGEPFDAILLDAPCSASGIVRRHPDIPWLRRATDIDALAKLQASLIDACLSMLAPGGRLLFATCSIFKAEGQAQIDALMQRRGAQAPVLHPASPGHLLPLPDNAGEAASHDGFFYALLTTT